VCYSSQLLFFFARAQGVVGLQGTGISHPSDRVAFQVVEDTTGEQCQDGGSNDTLGDVWADCRAIIQATSDNDYALAE